MTHVVSLCVVEYTKHAASRCTNPPYSNANVPVSDAQVAEATGRAADWTAGCGGSSISLLRLLTLPDTLRSDERSGLTPPTLRVSETALKQSFSRLLLKYAPSKFPPSPSRLTPEWVSSTDVVFGPLTRSAVDVGCSCGRGLSWGGTLELDRASVRRLLNELFRRRR